MQEQSGNKVQDGCRRTPSCLRKQLGGSHEERTIPVQKTAQVFMTTRCFQGKAFLSRLKEFATTHMCYRNVPAGAELSLTLLWSEVES